MYWAFVGAYLLACLLTRTLFISFFLYYTRDITDLVDFSCCLIILEKCNEKKSTTICQSHQRLKKCKIPQRTTSSDFLSFTLYVRQHFFYSLPLSASNFPILRKFALLERNKLYTTKSAHTIVD